MSRLALVITSMFLTNFLFSCSPQQGSTTPNNDRVSEYVINDLTSSRWCQLNSAGSAVEYTWTFTKNYKATSIAADASAENFNWSITNNNILSVYLPNANSTIFSKQVSYKYNVSAHRRTMRWTDPQAQQTCDNQGVCTITSSDAVNFVECD